MKCCPLTNILNQQFQSVFTHDPPHDIPDKGPSPIMEQIHINDKGVLNLVPILFLIYNNDFPDYLTHSKLSCR